MGQLACELARMSLNPRGRTRRRSGMSARLSRRFTSIGGKILRRRFSGGRELPGFTRFRQPSTLFAAVSALPCRRDCYGSCSIALLTSRFHLASVFYVCLQRASVSFVYNHITAFVALASFQFRRTDRRFPFLLRVLLSLSNGLSSGVEISK